MVGEFSCSTRDLSKKGSVVIPGSPVELVRITQDTCLKIDIEGVGCLTTEFKN